VNAITKLNASGKRVKTRKPRILGVMKARPVSSFRRPLLFEAIAQLPPFAAAPGAAESASQPFSR